MRKICSVFLLMLMIVSTLLISGCTPPDYSDDKAKKIVSEHSQEATDWFQKNLPDAKVDKKVEAFATTNSLLAAVKGSYIRNGRSYGYVYAYRDKKMYVEEGYEESCKLIKQRILKEMGLTEQETVVKLHGYTIVADSENDKPREKENNASKNGSRKLGIGAQKLKPAAMTPQEFADAVLAQNTKESLDFYLHVYKNVYPEPKQELLAKYKNLGAVFYNVPVDVTKNEMVVSQKIYNSKGVKVSYCRFAKINNYLYGGYISPQGRPAEDKIKVHNQDDKNFTLEVLADSKVVFFSTKEVKLVHHFQNANNQLIENEAKKLSRSPVAALADCHEYDGNIVVKDNVFQGYTSLRVPRVKGIYEFKIMN